MARPQKGRGGATAGVAVGLAVGWAAVGWAAAAKEAAATAAGWEEAGWAAADLEEAGWVAADLEEAGWVGAATAVVLAVNSHSVARRRSSGKQRTVSWQLAVEPRRARRGTVCRVSRYIDSSAASLLPRGSSVTLVTRARVPRFRTAVQLCLCTFSCGARGQRFAPPARPSESTRGDATISVT